MHHTNSRPDSDAPSSHRPRRLCVGTPIEEVRAEYRRQARALHPDASGDPATAPAFQALVEAFRAISGVRTGSLESHPLWHKLSSLDRRNLADTKREGERERERERLRRRYCIVARYWSREQGYDTAFLLRARQTLCEQAHHSHCGVEQAESQLTCQRSANGVHSQLGGVNTGRDA